MRPAPLRCSCGAFIREDGRCAHARNSTGPQRAPEAVTVARVHADTLHSVLAHLAKATARR